jgi:hypothetical protein
MLSQKSTYRSLLGSLSVQYILHCTHPRFLYCLFPFHAPYMVTFDKAVDAYIGSISPPLASWSSSLVSYLPSCHDMCFKQIDIHDPCGQKCEGLIPCGPVFCTPDKYKATRTQHLASPCGECDFCILKRNATMNVVGFTTIKYMRSNSNF